jgi:hypothetical protein
MGFNPDLYFSSFLQKLICKTVMGGVLPPFINICEEATMP